MIDIPATLGKLIASEVDPKLKCIPGSNALMLLVRGECWIFKLDGGTLSPEGLISTGHSFRVKYDLANEVELVEFLRDLRSSIK